MSIESAAASVAESVVAGAAESAASSVASSAVSAVASGTLKTVFGAVIPAPASIFSGLKIAGYVIAAAAACYLVYRAVTFVEAAATNAAAVQVLTGQGDAAISNEATERTALVTEQAKTEALAPQILAFTKADAVRKTAANPKVEAIIHAPKTSGCVPSAALLNGLGGLR